MAVEPRVSCVMPVYNGAAHLQEAADSVLGQTWEDLELVIVDDGSVDGTTALAQQLADAQPERVRLVALSQNGGVAEARNRGVKAARGELIAYCDSDDVQLPHRVEAQVRLFEAYPDAGLVCSDFSTWLNGHVSEPSHLRTVRMGPRRGPLEATLRHYLGAPVSARSLGVGAPVEQACVYHGDGHALLCLFHLAWGCASMYRKTAMNQAGGHHADLRTYEDWQLAGQVAKRHPIVFLDAPLVYYRTHPGQVHTQHVDRNAATYLDVLTRVWLRDGDFCSQHSELTQRVHALAHLKVGHERAAQADWRAARHHFLRSARLRPRQGGVYRDLARATLRSLLPA